MTAFHASQDLPNPGFHPFLRGLAFFWIGLVCLVLVPFLQAQEALDPQPGPGKYFVSKEGNDTWSGRFAGPNPAGNDGPFATVERALAEHRKARFKSTIFLKEGTHYLSEPLVLTPDDSGCTWAAYPGETAVISGGKPITGWQEGANGIWAAAVPEIRAERWSFREMRSGKDLYIPARAPNRDEVDVKGGWFFAAPSEAKVGAFRQPVSKIHNKGDWIEWKVTVPADGTYKVWFLYGSANLRYRITDLGDRMTLAADGNVGAKLRNLPDTGALTTYRWGDVADLPLGEGGHTLRWTNMEGGFMNLDAIVLSDDPRWNPAARGARPATGNAPVVIQAEAFSSHGCREIEAPETRGMVYQDRFQYQGDDFPAARSYVGAEVHVVTGIGEAGWIYDIRQVDRRNRLVTLVAPRSGAPSMQGGTRYYVSHLGEVLDAAGEFHVNTLTSSVMMMPRRADFIREGVSAAFHDRIFDLQGDAAGGRWVEQVSFIGLGFRDTTYTRTGNPSLPSDAAIWMTGAREVRFEGCTFFGLGGHAIKMLNHSEKIDIIGNEFSQLGQGVLFLAGRDGKKPLDVRFEDNWVHDTSTLMPQAPAILAFPAERLLVEHNRFEAIPGTAVALRSVDAANASKANRIAYNEFTRVCRELHEVPAILVSAPHKEDTLDMIQGNKFMHLQGLGTDTGGIWLDPPAVEAVRLADSTSGVTIQGNALSQVSDAAFVIQGGRNNVIDNNILHEVAKHPLEIVLRDTFCANNTWTRNIVVWTTLTPKIIHAEGTWRNGVFKECDRNVYWNPQGPLFFRKADLTPAETLEKWKMAGYDATSLVGDPRLADPGRGNFTPAPGGSPSQVAFQPLFPESPGPRRAFPTP